MRVCEKLVLKNRHDKQVAYRINRKVHFLLPLSLYAKMCLLVAVLCIMLTAALRLTFALLRTCLLFQFISLLITVSNTCSACTLPSTSMFRFFSKKKKILIEYSVTSLCGKIKCREKNAHKLLAQFFFSALVLFCCSMELQ